MPTSAESYRRPFLRPRLRPHPHPHPHPHLTFTLKLSAILTVSLKRDQSLTPAAACALALAPTLTLALALTLQPHPLLCLTPLVHRRSTPSVDPSLPPHDPCLCVVQDIAAEILEKVKAASGEMPRYKLVCQATVGESNGQSMRVASRCLWDKDFDTCAETTWTNVRAPLAATLFHHTALVWRPYAEPRQLSPSRRLPARTEQGVRRCDVLCVVLRVSERAGPLRRSRLLQDAAAQAAVRALRSSALRARSAPPAPAGRITDVGAWLHRTAQVYPFLPPRRSPGLILSLDYSFQMHEKYNATNFSISYLAKH